MGIRKALKRWMVTKKSKKDKKFSWGQLVFVLVIMFLVLVIGSFTSYGAMGYKYLADKHPDSSWAPWALWKSGKLFYFWGDSFNSYKSYEAYVKRYGEKHPENILEAEFWKICCLNDGAQYTRCMDDAEDFLEEFEDHEESEWFKKVDEISKSIKAMDMGKRYNHPWY